MKIAIGSDHGGYLLKQEVMQHLKDRNIEFVDCGSYDDKSCDYPEYAKAVASEITSKKADLGILICGTGIGMSMAAFIDDSEMNVKVAQSLGIQTLCPHNNEDWTVFPEIQKLLNE